MLLLTGANDLVRVITSAAVTTDVHASYVDLNGTTVTPGRTNTPITTATTTTVVGSPGASIHRTVKTLTVRNRHASTAQDVTIVHTDGTNAMELIKTTLMAGECLHYHEASGFWITDVLGRAKTAQFAAVGAVGVTGMTTVVLGSDQTNNNATPNTIQDVTGLSFGVLANKLYYFQFNIVYTSAATTTGSRWTVSGPATTYLLYRSEYSLTATTTTRNAVLGTYDLPAGSNATSGAIAQNWAQIEGVIQPSAGGTVIARFASEVGGSAIVAKIGSHVSYQQITA